MNVHRMVSIVGTMMSANLASTEILNCGRSDVQLFQATYELHVHAIMQSSAKQDADRATQGGQICILKSKEVRKKTKLECGPMPNVMVALPNIGSAFCSTPQSLDDAHY